MMASDHFDLELQDLLDDRLTGGERDRVQAHVDQCARCHQALDELRRGRDFACHYARRAEVPRALEEDLSRLLRGSASSAPAADGRRGIAVRRRRVLVSGFSALGAAAALFVAVYLRRPVDLPGHAIRSYATAARSGSRLEVVTSDPPTLERYFAARLSFRTRVFDLGMMNYRLVGGRTENVGKRASALYVYEGPIGARLLCEMYQGDLAELPAPTERRSHNDLTFLVYRRGTETAVFWAEGGIVCVLVSELPAENVLALAFAKAMKP